MKKIEDIVKMTRGCRENEYRSAKMLLIILIQRLKKDYSKTWLSIQSYWLREQIFHEFEVYSHKSLSNYLRYLTSLLRRNLHLILIYWSVLPSHTNSNSSTTLPPWIIEPSSCSIPSICLDLNKRLSNTHLWPPNRTSHPSTLTRSQQQFPNSNEQISTDLLRMNHPDQSNKQRITSSKPTQPYPAID